MEIDLDTEVRQLLAARRGEWQTIARQADVSHSWISQFVRGVITNPGIQTLKRLRQLLKEAPRAACRKREAA